jgi:hypothetical protein
MRLHSPAFLRACPQHFTGRDCVIRIHCTCYRSRSSPRGIRPRMCLRRNGWLHCSPCEERCCTRDRKLRSSTRRCSDRFATFPPEGSFSDLHRVGHLHRCRSAGTNRQVSYLATIPVARCTSRGMGKKRLTYA